MADKMSNIPDKYKWLTLEPGPRALTEALTHYGTLERTGLESNPNIIRWAAEIGVSGFYKNDDIPWCGLFVGVIMQRAGYNIPRGLDSLAARNWLNFGNIVIKGGEKLWDILVFKREGGGHVGFYVGENDHAFLVYGGNQANAVGFAWIDKKRLLGARRARWKFAQPKNIRKIYLGETGELSTNEG